MDEIDFARKHLGDYKVTRSGEISAKYCPFCGGGRHRDTYTFALNKEKHAYVCKRGSCGRKGTFKELAEEFNEKADYVIEYQKKKFDNKFKKKSYIKPDVDIKPPVNPIINYLNLRCISQETIEHFGIKSDKNGNIVFPYTENGELVLVKYRRPCKYIKGKSKGPKMWQEGGGKPILFNVDNVTKTVDKPLVIAEGEIDAMAIYEAGYENVVSIPFGVNDFNWIDECWDFLEKQKEIILFFDNDDPGQIAINEAAKKLGIYKCKIVKKIDVKDANEILFKLGKEKLLELINDAKFIPIADLERLSDAKKEPIQRILWGLNFLDKNLGGRRMGELTIWTGKRGGGKSTIVSQFFNEMVQQKTRGFIYSGELNNYRVRTWLERQIVGDRYITTSTDELTGREEYEVHPKVSEIISDWYSDYIFTYSDAASSNQNNLFEIMEYAYRRYNVKIFVLDNLKTIVTKGRDKFDGQSNFVKRCVDFKNNFNVHIDLVVHPRKTKETMKDEDVGGTSDIIDLADNIIEVARLREEDKETEIELYCRFLAKKNLSKEESIQKAKLKRQQLEGMSTRLSILKNRTYGDTHIKEYYEFQPVSKTIKEKDDKNVQNNRSWEDKIEDRNFVINMNLENRIKKQSENKTEKKQISLDDKVFNDDDLTEIIGGEIPF